MNGMHSTMPYEQKISNEHHTQNKSAMNGTWLYAAINVDAKTQKSTECIVQCHMQSYE